MHITVLAALYLFSSNMPTKLPSLSTKRDVSEILILIILIFFILLIGSASLLIAIDFLDISYI